MLGQQQVFDRVTAKWMNPLMVHDAKALTSTIYVETTPSKDWHKYIYVICVNDSIEGAMPGITPAHEVQLMAYHLKLLDFARCYHTLTNWTTKGLAHAYEHGMHCWRVETVELLSHEVA